MSNSNVSEQTEREETLLVDSTKHITEARAFQYAKGRQHLTFVPPVGAGKISTASSRGSVVDSAEAYERIVLQHLRQRSSNQEDVMQKNCTSQSSDSAIQPFIATADTPTTSKSSLAHQVSLEHSWPPSHLDRTSKGLRYLEAYGWDIDERRGLGPQGEGLRAPLKSMAKYNTAGLGAELLNNSKAHQHTVARSLDAGKVRKKYTEDRKRHERLRQTIFGDGRMERYLGSHEEV